MIDHWFEPQIIEMLIYDLSNYFIFFFIFYFLFKNNYIGKNLFLISSILLLTPFLFNGFLFDWSYLPDQTKYVTVSQKIRNEYFNPYIFLFCEDYKILNENCDPQNLKIYLSSFIYSLSPIVNYETFKSIGFYNRFLFIISLIFFYKKKVIDKNLFLLFLFSPSLILFSSVSLRDNLILLIMLFWIFYFFEKKYFKSLFISFLILIIKKQNFFILIFSTLLYSINSKKVYVKYLAISLFFIILLIFIIRSNEIFWWINYYRAGLFFEEFGQYKSISSVLFYEKIKLDLNIKSIYLSIIGFLNFFFSPISDLTSIIKIIIFIENIILYLILGFQFKKNFKSNRKVTLIWIAILIFSFMMYGIFVFNDGQIHRYKTPIIFFVMFAYYINLNKKSIK